MYKDKFIKFSAIFSMLIPNLVFAATIKSVIDKITGSLSGIPALLISVAIIYFLIAVLQYASGGDQKTREEAVKKITFGLLGILIMISMWGFVDITKNSLGL